MQPCCQLVGEFFSLLVFLYWSVQVSAGIENLATSFGISACSAIKIVLHCLYTQYNLYIEKCCWITYRLVIGNGILRIQYVDLMFCSAIWKATEERLSTSSDQGSTTYEGARPTVSETMATTETVPYSMSHSMTSHSTSPCFNSDSCSCAEACDSSVKDINKEKGVLQVHCCKMVLFYVFAKSGCL